MGRYLLSFVLGLGLSFSSTFGQLPEPIASFPDRPSILSVKYSEVLDQIVVMTTHGIETRNPQTGALVETVTEFETPIQTGSWGDISPDGTRWALVYRFYSIYAEGVYFPTAERLMVGSIENGQVLVDSELSFLDSYHGTFSSDSAFLYTEANAQSLGIIDAEPSEDAIAVVRASDGELEEYFAPNIGRIYYIELSPDGDELLVSGSGQNSDFDSPTLAVIDLVSSSVTYPPVSGSGTRGAAFSPDGLRIHSGDSVWDSTDDTVSPDGLSGILDDNCYYLVELEFSEDGELLSKLWSGVGNYPRSLIVESYDLSSGEMLTSFESGYFLDYISDDPVSGEPRLLSMLNGVEVVNALTGQTIWQLREPYGPRYFSISRYAFSSDEALLAQLGEDYIEILNLETNISRRMFLESSSTRGIGFADETTLIVSQPDGSAEFRVADPSSAQFGTVLRTEQPMTHQATEMKIFRTGSGSSEAIYALSVAGDQSTCDSGFSTFLPAESALWDVSDGSVIWRADRDLSRSVDQVDVSSDGAWLRVGTELFPLMSAPYEGASPVLAVERFRPVVHFNADGVLTDYTEYLRKLTDPNSPSYFPGDQLQYDQADISLEKSLLFLPYEKDLDYPNTEFGLYLLNASSGELIQRLETGSPGFRLGPNGETVQIDSAVYSTDDLLSETPAQ
jgi:WD40 repeat protein